MVVRRIESHRTAASGGKEGFGLMLRNQSGMVLGVVVGMLLIGAPLTSTVASASSGAGASAGGAGVRYGPADEIDVNACAAPMSVGYAHCLARVRTDAWARNRRPVAQGRRLPAAELGNDGAYDPAFLQSAYATPSAADGVGQTVAIVDAYDDPHAYSDMAYYRSYFGLPACSAASGCFQKVNESGGTGSYPSPSSSWGQEISLDLDMVSAICPNCHILLVEANTSSLENLGTAVNTAVKLGANVVTNSYGASEYSTEESDATAYYAHSGVAITAASGDSGYEVEFPAASPSVTAVGGTTLYQATNTGTRNATEEAWSGAGSGCSAYELQRAWQLALVQEYSLSACYMRMVADVSAVANPSTGVWVYDTYSNPGFEVFGGTSVSTQIVGAIYALADNQLLPSEPASYPYGHLTALNYIHTGSNGTCGTYLCNAADSEHYNGPTGLGTPNGTVAFSAASSSRPPSAPTGLTAKPGNAEVHLSWSAPSSTGGATVSYEVFRGTSAGGEATAPIATNVTSVNFTDRGLTNGTTYYYTVEAVDSAGSSAASGEASATPSVCPDAWTNAAGGSWFTAGNWSEGAPPGPEEAACITAPGTYTVTMDQTSATGTVSVGSLTIGETAGTHTLVVAGTCTKNAILATTQGIGIRARGAIAMTNGDECANDVTLAGPVSNSGKLYVEDPHGGARSIEGSLTNDNGVSLAAGAALRIAGSYEQTSAGWLTTFIAGAFDYGSMSVADETHLAGTLATRQTPPFVASAGQTFSILTGASLTGTFATETGAQINYSGLYYKPAYSATAVALAVAQAGFGLSANSGLPGSTVTLGGGGYLPGDTITPTFTDHAGVKTVLPSVTVHHGGGFSTEIKIPALAAAGAGTIAITSTQTGVHLNRTFTVI